MMLREMGVGVKIYQQSLPMEVKIVMFYLYLYLFMSGYFADNFCVLDSWFKEDS